HPRPDSFATPFRNKVPYRTADDVARLRRTEKPSAGRVDEHDLLAVPDHDQVRRQLHDGPIAFLAFAQGALGRAATGDVVIAVQHADARNGPRDHLEDGAVRKK